MLRRWLLEPLLQVDAIRQRQAAVAALVVGSMVREEARELLKNIADIERIVTIFDDCLDRYEGPFLFGDFSIADAFFAPVVTRFATYGVPLEAALAAYSARMFELPAMQEWVAAARLETEVLEDH